MESFGSFFDEDWESLSIMFSGDQDYGLNFETPSIVSSESNHSFIHHHSLCYASENINPNLYHHQHNINGCGAYDVAASLAYTSSNTIPLPLNGGCDNDLFDESNTNVSFLFSDDTMEEILCWRQDVNIENSAGPSVPSADQRKRKIESSNVIVDKVNEDKPDKKKTMVSKDNKNKKKVQPKKKQKVMSATVNGDGVDGEDTTNNNNNKGGGGGNASSSSCSSEDDCQDSNGGAGAGAGNSNWKMRAGRGAATDPQSLYARKRRERINERLKTLQTLVPNGTKVDISTMLEEAVDYVKFLQLQIKLLSSDDMWMYAPIAYNGMDMGLYQKLQI